jgi:hypothetical protein
MDTSIGVSQCREMLKMLSGKLLNKMKLMNI